ncbi:MAG: hypothetical protein CM15mV37_0630 [uncultured marine virus]|nr:MAG: hypothetical protein CM15mV37_0630 [uncultured marine virus]
MVFIQENDGQSTTGNKVPEKFSLNPYQYEHQGFIVH